MGKTSKPIRLSQHARERLTDRGTSEAEIIETIQSCTWKAAELKRLACSNDYPYGKNWNNTFYKTKRVHSIFVEEKQEIVVVTVYVYYF